MQLEVRTARHLTPRNIGAAMIADGGRSGAANANEKFVRGREWHREVLVNSDVT